jgi:hypothetical protein
VSLAPVAGSTAAQAAEIREEVPAILRQGPRGAAYGRRRNRALFALAVVLG